MDYNLKNLPSTEISEFVIDGIDQIRHLVICADKKLGLWIEINTAKKPLKDAKITGPYEIKFKYVDGTSEIKKILD